MNWKIRFRVNKTANSPISTIRIDADSLREACIEVVSLYRDATILEYQEGEGALIQFDLSDIGAQSYPIDPNAFSAIK
ncbi:hypothetical protein [Polynucleobacter sp. MWH-UH2A]|uniref:hypothetical protein n=1 Tax=Polynucleobacter sp. MWH-UH2A TaxID=1855617 RepID=UPI001BFD43CA|nr:hypothetical protein [Polynucleobacter sp. MWH-UH2A]QWD63863.1 hypothetical protein IC571_09300 [Polynucleobacter sp. MWH-UH2A]